jgi:hypothetical protein
LNPNLINSVKLDEKVTQLKIFFNLILINHRETMRRAIKFNYSNKFVMKNVRLVQESMSSLHNIYEQLLLEIGIDPDLPFTLFAEKLLAKEKEGLNV